MVIIIRIIMKEIVKEKGSMYLKKLKEEKPEKIKEYAKRAFVSAVGTSTSGYL